MANETMEEMASLAEDIFIEGIRVSMKRGDPGKLFAAVIVANVVTYLTIVGVKTYMKSTALKAETISPYLNSL